MDHIRLDARVSRSSNTQIVTHPSVARDLALHRDDAYGVVGLVTDDASGESVEASLEGRGPLDEQTAIEAGIPVAWALAAIHDAGIVHRNVKPTNITEHESAASTRCSELLLRRASGSSARCELPRPPASSRMSQSSATNSRLSPKTKILMDQLREWLSSAR